MKIEIVEYNSDWVKAFEEEKKNVLELLGSHKWVGLIIAIIIVFVMATKMVEYSSLCNQCVIDLCEHIISDKGSL